MTNFAVKFVKIMDFKRLWKENNLVFMLKMVGLAAVVGICVITAAVYWLDSYTHHGEEVPVTDVTGMYVEEASMLLRGQNLQLVVVDSTYSKKVPLGTIVEQNPPADSKVKLGRPIYIVVNARSVRQVALPKLADMSLRQAESALKTVGLEVEDIEYEPSEYKDLVLDVKRGGVSLTEGTRLPEGAAVVLVVGFGIGTEEIAVPNLQGLSVVAARRQLLSNRFILGAVDYLEELTADNAEQFVVYEQSPAAGTLLLEGNRVNVKVTTDAMRAANANAESNTNSDEDFF